MSDKATKTPYPATIGVANGIHELGLKRGIMLYQGSGTVDGTLGDHILLAPAYTATESLIMEIVDLTQRVIEEYFETLEAKA